MIHVFPVLFGALFTLATAWSLGMVILDKVALSLYRWEQRFLAFVVGAACLSEIIFALCAAKLAHRGIFLALGLAIIGYAAYSRSFHSSGKAFQPLARLWRWIFIATFAAFTFYGFFNALAPEHSSDGMSYHLSQVLIYRDAHGFPLITTDFHASLSEGIELLYLFAFDFGRHSAAALVHYSFLIALVFMLLSYGRRIQRPEAAVAAALFTYLSPVVLRDATTAYVDVALPAVLFALFYLLQIWDECRDNRLLVPIGIVAGFGYAVKYTAFLAVPYAVGFVAWKLWRAQKPLFRAVLAVTLLSAAMILPWMLKNWIEVANPLSPFANRVFPNPYVHVAFEDYLRQAFTTYDLKSRWQIPLEATIKGGQLQGFLGPIFLLTPLALLAIRFREGRQLLLATLVFGCTYFSNIGTRFLIPVVPFVSLAIVLAIANLPWLLLGLVAANAILCWPGMYHIYCTNGAWRLENVPIKAALRLESEDHYLSQDPDYRIAQMVGRVVPPGNRIFAIGLGGRSYLPRDVIVGFQGAANEVMQDILWTPKVEAYQPTRLLKFDFPPRQIRKLRVVMTGSEGLDQWSMSELRIFDGPKELPRESSWRLTAHPNPWDVQLAFDNSLVTRWRSWQPAAPGMYVQADLGRAQQASSVVVESSGDMINTQIALQAMRADGAWTTICGHPSVAIRRIRVNLRTDATAELKSRGINYVFVRPDDPFASDLETYPDAWGLTLVGQQDGSRVYRIR
jgi:hypothetical protein